MALQSFLQEIVFMRKFFVLFIAVLALFSVKDVYASSVCTINGIGYELGAAIEKYGMSSKAVIGCCNQTQMCGPGYVWEKDGVGMDLTLIAAKNNYYNALVYFVKNRNCRVESWPYAVGKGKEIKDYTPLMWAIMNRNYEMADFLLSRGASAFKQNQWGKSAIDYAKDSGNIKLINLLSKRRMLFIVNESNWADNHSFGKFPHR